MTLPLPEIQPEKWRRYHFESKDRYYTVILQQDLFHEWSIIKCYGGKDNKLGNMIIESCDSYEGATCPYGVRLLLIVVRGVSLDKVKWLFSFSSWWV